MKLEGNIHELRRWRKPVEGLVVNIVGYDVESLKNTYIERSFAGIFVTKDEGMVGCYM